eukprot:snap_masked-scaffold_23-processed-gene-5.50-mRNA-1 protein AED:0.52 eAED:0.53 QI:0/0/0/1/1/1/2/0/858
MAESLLLWRANFGFAENFLIITDNGSHFSNNLLHYLSKSIGFEQNFTIAYSPWTNGSVETANNSILNYLKSLVSQFGLHESQWPSILSLITYIINNKPMERRDGRTPNELNTPLIERDLQHFTITVGNEVHKPLDKEAMFSDVENIITTLDTIQNQTFEVVRLKQEAENSRRNKTATPILQFSSGDWVLVSEHGTQHANAKTSLSWIGPYQIIDILSSNVYLVESLLGKTRTVHSSRIWFYSHTRPIGSKKLKALFVHNFKQLEIESIVGCRLAADNNSCEFKIRWLGFEQDQDTWEPAVTIYEDVPILVTSYVQNMDDNNLKMLISRILQDHDVSRRNQLARVNSLKFRLSSMKFQKQLNFHFISGGNTLGWLPEEKNILRLLIMKFGSGKYVEYLEGDYLPFRSKQQISTQIQRLCNLQSIGIFHNRRFDVVELRTFLQKHFGIKTMHKNLPGRFNTYIEKTKILTLFSQEIEITSKPEDIKIPYFRRIENLKHLRLMEKEYADSDECQQFLLQFGISSFEALKSRILNLSEPLVKAVEGSELLLDTLYKTLLKSSTYWTDLSTLYSKSITFCQEFDELRNTPNSYSYRQDSISISLVLIDNKVQLTSVDLLSGDKIILEYNGGNYYTLLGCNGRIYFTPPDTRLFSQNIFDLEFEKPYSKHNIFQILVVDPPWKIGNSNPTRGITLDYPTLSNSEFMKLDLPLQHFPFGSYLFLWVTNSSYHCALSWAKSLNYYSVDIFTWIKSHRSGSLFKSLGYFLQHAQETCLIFQRREQESIYYSDTFGEYKLDHFSNSIKTIPLEPSAKPETFYWILDLVFPHCNKFEMFARSNNLRQNWSSCGIELDAKAHIVYTPSSA